MSGTAIPLHRAGARSPSPALCAGEDFATDAFLPHEAKRNGGGGPAEGRWWGRTRKRRAARS
jgi:hypothetical protein